MEAEGAADRLAEDVHGRSWPLEGGGVPAKGWNLIKIHCKAVDVLGPKVAGAPGCRKERHEERIKSDCVSKSARIADGVVEGMGKDRGCLIEMEQVE